MAPQIDPLPKSKRQTQFEEFEGRAEAFGSLVRDGRLSAASASKMIWEDGRARDFSDEYIAAVIDNVIEGEPRTNGADAQSFDDYGARRPDDAADIEPLETIDPADWDGQKPPERQWIIRNMIPLGEAGLLNGHGGAGKTLLGCQIAVGVNMQTDCLGFAVEHGGPVLLYSPEEREEELHRRLVVIVESRGKRLGDLKGFRIYCPPPTETMLTTVGRDGLVLRVEDLRPA